MPSGTLPAYYCDSTSTLSNTMSNFNLNLGGLFGALLGGAAIAAIIFLALQPKPDEFGRLFAKLVIFGVVGGAAAGNFAWAAVFSKK